ncbi:MAG: Dam family site-specific DNA-(adenine-N6)-methyltransferase [Acidobacteriota bacterium]|nr:Dam family site-specific DNA-(adenine-N6)-methyltransferase [Acidobacteriota bacterium]
MIAASPGVPAAAPPPPVRPLLKWAGGKRQLLPHIRRFVPDHFPRYLEPFFGSGAVFFDLHSRGLLAGRPAILLDINADLVGCYGAVRDEPEAVIAALRRLARGHAQAPEAHYYRVRDGRFNPAREKRRHDGTIAYTPALAAMLIYLNRTGFNGLFRVNRQGRFNVPAGRYARPAICDADHLRRVSAALRGPHVRLALTSFDAVETLAQAGDFVYLDPPYVPVSRTAHFTAYTPCPFGPAEQARLQQIAIALARRGCGVLLSNSTAPDVARLYDGHPEAVAAGLRAYRVPARRAINARATGRGPVAEYLITNLPERETEPGAAGRC